jgi:hypothetical protein
MAATIKNQPNTGPVAVRSGPVSIVAPFSKPSPAPVRPITVTGPIGHLGNGLFG